jgi:hypothetical protein
VSEQLPSGGIELSPAAIEALNARWSSSHARPKDQTDFDETIPHMTPAQRQTLAELLARARPGNQWLASL